MGMSIKADLSPLRVLAISPFSVSRALLTRGPNRFYRYSMGMRGVAALAGAGRRHVLFDAREAEDAVLADLLDVVEVDLLVGAGLQAEAVAATAGLVAEDNAVLTALVHSVAGAGLHADWAGAVVAETGQVEEEGVGVFATALVLVPVGPPGGLLADGLEEDGASLAAVEDLVVVEVPAAAALRAGGDGAGEGGGGG